MTEFEDVFRAAIELESAWRKAPRLFQTKVENGVSGDQIIVRRALGGFNIGSYTEDGMWNQSAFIPILRDAQHLAIIPDSGEENIALILSEAIKQVS